MRILVVEDESDLAEGIADGLRGDGYAVDIALDGATALDRLAHTPYDLVCLDVLLPDDAVVRARDSSDERESDAPPDGPEPLAMSGLQQERHDRVGHCNDAVRPHGRDRTQVSRLGRPVPCGT